MPEPVSHVLQRACIRAVDATKGLPEGDRGEMQLKRRLQGFGAARSSSHADPVRAAPASEPCISLCTEREKLMLRKSRRLVSRTLALAPFLLNPFVMQTWEHTQRRVSKMASRITLPPLCSSESRRARRTKPSTNTLASRQTAVKDAVDFVTLLFLPAKRKA